MDGKKLKWTVRFNRAAVDVLAEHGEMEESALRSAVDEKLGIKPTVIPQWLNAGSLLRRADEFVRSTVFSMRMNSLVDAEIVGSSLRPVDGGAGKAKNAQYYSHPVGSGCTGRACSLK